MRKFSSIVKLNLWLCGSTSVPNFRRKTYIPLKNFEIINEILNIFQIEIMIDNENGVPMSSQLFLIVFRQYLDRFCRRVIENDVVYPKFAVLFYAIKKFEFNETVIDRTLVFSDKCFFVRRFLDFIMMVT